jgi:hypothetical protein
LLHDTATRIEYDPNSAIKPGDFFIYVPAWYTQLHQGSECEGAMSFYEHVHDDHVYGGPVLLDSDGVTLYVNVNLPMTTETNQPLTTATADSVLGSTYQGCWAQDPSNAAAAAAAAARLRKLMGVRRKMQGWTPGPGDFVLTTDVIDVINE